MAGSEHLQQFMTINAVCDRRHPLCAGRDITVAMPTFQDELVPSVSDSVISLPRREEGVVASAVNLQPRERGLQVMD